MGKKTNKAKIEHTTHTNRNRGLVVNYNGKSKVPPSFTFQMYSSTYIYVLYYWGAKIL